MYVLVFQQQVYRVVGTYVNEILHLGQVCNLTRFVAETGHSASEVKTGEGMRQSLNRGLALLHGLGIRLRDLHTSGWDAEILSRFDKP
jgi:hypothetical protein